MTKRPFAYIGLPMLVAFTVSFYFRAEIITVVAAVVIFISALVLRRLRENRSALITIAVSLLLSVVVFLLYDADFYKASSVYDGRKAAVSGVVKSVSSAHNYSETLGLEAETIDGQPTNCRIAFNVTSHSGISYGDRLKMTAELSRCKDAYELSKGYRYRITSFEYNTLLIEHDQNRDIGYVPIYLRSILVKSGRELIGGSEGEYCNAVTLGDKNSMSPELYGVFQKTGLSYIIVVSGMHMSVIALFLMGVFNTRTRGRVRRLVNCALIIIALLLYAGITGFSPSAVRSAIMMIIIVVGKATSRDADVYNSLGFAAIALTLLNPYAVGDIGMILSFVSVFGIILLGKPFIERIDLKFREKNTALFLKEKRCDSYIKIMRVRLRRVFYNIPAGILQLIVVSAAANVAVTPIALLYFGEWHPFVILYSLLFAPTLTLLMMFTLLAAVLYLLPFVSPFAIPFVFAAKCIAWLNINTAKKISGSGFSAYYAEPTYTAAFLTLAAIIFAVAMLFRRRRFALSVAAAFTVLIFTASYAVLSLLALGKTTLNVYNTGRGTAIALDCGGNVSVLSCGGRRRYTSEVINSLLTETRSLDVLLVPSNLTQESSYASDMINTFDVNHILLYYNIKTGNPLYSLASDNEGFTDFGAGESFTLSFSNGVTDEVINHDGHTWQYITSDSVSVLVVPYNGKVYELPEQYRDPDIVLLAKEPDYFRNEIDYGKAYWLSDAPIPDGLRNCESITKNIEIDMN